MGVSHSEPVLYMIKYLYITTINGSYTFLPHGHIYSYTGSPYLIVYSTISIVTQGLSSEDLLVNLYLLVLSNVESWVDVDYSLCEKLVQGGMLLQNINDLQYLEKMPVDKSEVIITY